VNAKGYGVTDSVAGVQLSVFDSVFTQQDPGVANDHRAIALYHGEASADIEHNSFTNTDGIWLAANTSAGVTLASVKVDYNVATNIGRYPHETANFGCCVAFFQLSQVRSAVIEAAWNKVTNVYGQSSEDGDNINFWNSGGTDTTHKADIRNNLIDGAYPPGGTNDTQFTGGGINVGDANDHNANVHNNTVVSTTNYGVSGVSAAGVVDTHIYDNLLVNDGAEQASAFGNAQEMWNPSGSISATCTATGNSYNWHRSTTDATQYPCYQSANCTGSVLVSTTEQQARDAWESSRIAAGVTIGPQ
jgi:hypothetical protein